MEIEHFIQRAINHGSGLRRSFGPEPMDMRAASGVFAGRPIVQDANRGVPGRPNRCFKLIEQQPGSFVKDVIGQSDCPPLYQKFC